MYSSCIRNDVNEKLGEEGGERGVVEQSWGVMSSPSLSKIVTVTIAGCIRIFGRLLLEGLSKVAVNVSASSCTSSSVMFTLKHCRRVMLPNPSRVWFVGRKSCRPEGNNENVYAFAIILKLMSAAELQFQHVSSQSD